MSDHRFDPLDRLAELFPDPGFTIERLEQRRARIRRRHAVVGGATATFGVAGVAALLAATIGFGGSNDPHRAVSSPVDSAATAPPAADRAAESTVGATGTSVPEPALPPPLPEEFTFCVPSNSATQVSTDDVWEVPSPAGDVVIEQGAGTTWRGTATSSDPRFEGTHYHAESFAEYNYNGGGEGDDSGPRLTWRTERIENDEGAWQGSHLFVEFPDDTPEDGRTESDEPWVLIGEGAYEGLTAVLMWVDGPCFFNLQGYVMEVPAPPVPYTGE